MRADLHTKPLIRLRDLWCCIGGRSLTFSTPAREVQLPVSYDTSGERGFSSNRQSAVIWGRGIWTNRHI